VSDVNEKELHELLKRSIAPVESPELEYDLWPRMLQRLDQQPIARIPWFDWVLAALLGAACLFFPGMIPALLYHF
jgi:hypothetical protein